jgi:hypothetical protein
VVIEALAKETNVVARATLAEGLAALAMRMDPAVATRVLPGFIREGPSDEQWMSAQDRLAVALVESAGRVPPADAAQLLSRLLLDDCLICYNNAMQILAAGLVGAAGRIPSDEAHALCSNTAREMARALATTRDPYFLRKRAETIAILAGRMPSKDAASLCSDGARALLDTLAHAGDWDDSEQSVHADLGAGLAALAARMQPPAEAAAVR